MNQFSVAHKSLSHISSRMPSLHHYLSSVMNLIGKKCMLLLMEKNKTVQFRLAVTIQCFWLQQKEMPSDEDGKNLC